MPALLTAIVITCGALKSSSEVLACRAQIYHGAYAEPVACGQTAQELALEFERNIVAAGTMTRTSSHGECVSAADTADVTAFLPQFMREKMGAVSTRVVHLDLVDGVAVERAEKKTASKKAAARNSI